MKLFGFFLIFTGCLAVVGYVIAATMFKAGLGWWYVLPPVGRATVVLIVLLAGVIATIGERGNINKDGATA